jgi:hypothetical protein
VPQVPTRRNVTDGWFGPSSKAVSSFGSRRGPRLREGPHKSRPSAGHGAKLLNGPKALCETNMANLVILRATNWTVESVALADSIGVACLPCRWWCFR